MTEAKREHRETAVRIWNGIVAGGDLIDLEQALAEAEQRGRRQERDVNYGRDRKLREELLSVIVSQASKTELQAATYEWLMAWAPELVSGRYADIESGKHLKGEE